MSHFTSLKAYLEFMSTEKLASFRGLHETYHIPMNELYANWRENTVLPPCTNKELDQCSEASIRILCDLLNVSTKERAASILIPQDENEEHVAKRARLSIGELKEEPVKSLRAMCRERDLPDVGARKTLMRRVVMGAHDTFKVEEWMSESNVQRLELLDTRELRLLLASRDLKTTGTESVLINRWCRHLGLLAAIRCEMARVQLETDKLGRDVDQSTRFVFDVARMQVVGRYSESGQFRELTLDDIYECRERGFRYRLPLNLNLVPLT